MLQRNFPGNRDARRRRALERMKKVRHPSENLLEAIRNTQAKIRDNADSIRTKIARGKTGK
jgi:hypothetical protein